jgi:antitoxin VapB
MALSIKNQEAENLARELSKATGRSITQSVIGALRDALVRARGRRGAPSIRDAIVEISDRCAALPDQDTREADEILGYDESGGLK